MLSPIIRNNYSDIHPDLGPNLDPNINSKVIPSNDNESNTIEINWNDFDKITYLK